MNGFKRAVRGFRTAPRRASARSMEGEHEKIDDADRVRVARGCTRAFVIPDDCGCVGIGSNPTGQSKLGQPPVIGARPGNPTRARGPREWRSR